MLSRENVIRAIFYSLPLSLIMTVKDFFDGWIITVTMPTWLLIACNFILYFVIGLLVMLLLGWGHDKIKRIRKRD